MLVSELIDRTLAEWLYPGSDEQPQFDVLDTSIDSSTLDVVLEGRTEYVPRDSILEIGSELMLVKDSNGANVTLAKRAFNGSTPAAHSAGALVWVDPTFTRREVLNGLRSLIGKLYPWGIYDRFIDTTQTYTTRGVIDTATGTKEIHSILVRQPTTQERWVPLTFRGIDWVEYKQFDPPKILLRRGGAEGQAMRMVCIRDFTLPTAETDDLDTIGVPEALQEDLPMAVAGKVLSGREVPRATLDHIRELLAAQGVQPGSILNVGESLVSIFRRDAVAAERRRLAELDDPAFEWQRR